MIQCSSMMQLIKCKECGKSTIPLDSISVNIELSKSSCCDKCNETHTEKQYHFFCSISCFMTHMKIVLSKNEELQWREL